MDRDTATWAIPVVLAAIAAGGFWYYWQTVEEAPESPPVAETEPEPVEPAGPKYPLQNPEFSDGAEGELRELPALADSDEYFRLELTALYGEPIGNLLADAEIIERVVATVDNLPRSHVAERIRPVTALSGNFMAVSDGDDGYVINPDSYRRYDPLVSLVAEADVNDVTDLYRRFYPLFQKAYTDLGYPDKYFNDRLVEAIDDMLATPQVGEPVRLVRPHVNYEFADPKLQALSSGQKLLLRMGSDNAEKIKTKLRELRGEIAHQQIG